MKKYLSPQVINPKTGKVDKKKTKAVEIENMLYDSSTGKSNYILETEADVSKGDVGRRARAILKERKLKKKTSKKRGGGIVGRGMGIALRGGGIVSRSK